MHGMRHTSARIVRWSAGGATRRCAVLSWNLFWNQASPCTMQAMFRIYDERVLNRRLRLRPLLVVAIFATGAICGLTLSSSGPGMALAASAPVIVPVPAHAADTWCSSATSGNTNLRMSCELDTVGH